MKDHEFRESVSELRDIAIMYSNTGQLRARLSEFLSQFRDKCK